MTIKRHPIEVTTATAPAYWASYLINNDASSLDDALQAAADEWLRQREPWYVVDVERNEDGEAIEARFTWSFPLSQGGDVLDYVMHKVVEEGRS